MNEHLKNMLIALGGFGTLAGAAASWYESSKPQPQPVNNINVSIPLLKGTPDEHSAANAEPLVIKNYQGDSGDEVPDQLNHSAGW